MAGSKDGDSKDPVRTSSISWTGRGALVLGGIAIAWVAVSTSPSPPRCPPGLVALGARCCGEGQRLRAGACDGTPTRCSEGLEARNEACLAREGHVRLPRGTSGWKPPDTQVGSVGELAQTDSFAIDRTEVTWARYRRCVDAGKCTPVTPIAGGDPGQAAHGVTLDEAKTFCTFEGGRVPHDAEWLRVAIGDVEKRYPWGDPDAFCLRASYGLVSGPCAEGAKGPDTVGARPWGATPFGVLDVAGNVAEWVVDGGPAGKGVVRGGSFIDDDANALRARWRRVVEVGAREAWIGFRCAYD